MRLFAFALPILWATSWAWGLPTSRPTPNPQTKKTTNQHAQKHAAPVYKDPQVEQLTFEGVNGEAYFSPNGKQLIFQSYNRPAHRQTQIYIYDLETKKERRVTNHNGDDTCSYFHPIHGTILYASTKDEIRENVKFKKFNPEIRNRKHAEEKRKRAAAKAPSTLPAKRKKRRSYSWVYKPYEIYVADPNNKKQKRLTHATGYDAEGTYSPDGTKIIFSSRRDGDQELYIMNADGTNQRRLTFRRGNDGGAFISPSNKRVTWRSFDSRGNAQVLVADLVHDQLKNIRQLTFKPGINWAPYWHPSERWILFSSNRDQRGNFELYVVDIDGRCVKRLTHHPASDVLPVFSPDGQFIIFASKRFDNRSQLSRMNFVIPPSCESPSQYHQPNRVLHFPTKPIAKPKRSYHHHSRRYHRYKRSHHPKSTHKQPHAKGDDPRKPHPRTKKHGHKHPHVHKHGHKHHSPSKLPHAKREHSKHGSFRKHPHNHKHKYHRRDYAHKGKPTYRDTRTHRTLSKQPSRFKRPPTPRGTHSKTGGPAKPDSKIAPHRTKPIQRPAVRRQTKPHAHPPTHSHKSPRGHRQSDGHKAPHPHKYGPKSPHPHKYGHKHSHSHRTYRRHRSYGNRRSYRSYRHNKSHGQRNQRTQGKTPTMLGRAPWMRDLYFLSHPALEGRDAGTRGIEVAANYIAHQFKATKLQPGGVSGTFFQAFQTTIGVKLGTKNQLTWSQNNNVTSWKPKQDFVPFGFSSKGSHKGDVVFVGYGITDETSGYDDYKGIDVKGKTVLLFRYTPRWQSKTSPFGNRQSLYAEFRYKLLNARTHGAKAVLLVNPPRPGVDDKLFGLRLTRGLSDAGLLALHVRQSVATALLANQGKTLQGLWKQIEDRGKPASQLLKGSISLSVDLAHQRVQIRNVIGVLPGSDPKLKDEAIVIGAHYDHLGYGHLGSFPGNAGKIHPGADDNASGTAALIELARSFARAPAKRTLIFMAFAGEERGLLGSAHYVAHPTYPLARTVTMINLDMIGRMKGRRIVVHGSGTAPSFEKMLQRLSYQSGLRARLGAGGYGPSDHTSFYGKKIPVLFFFTGAHSDYHRPNDTFARLNVDGIERIIHLVSRTAREIANRPTRPQYRRVMNPRPKRKIRGGMRAYLGTIPDYGTRGIVGVKLTGARPGGPASKAGVKGGDILVQIGKFSLRNLYDMVIALKQYRAGQTVDLVVIRKGKRITLKATFAERGSSRR